MKLYVPDAINRDCDDGDQKSLAMKVSSLDRVHLTLRDRLPKPKLTISPTVSRRSNSFCFFQTIAQLLLLPCYWTLDRVIDSIIEHLSHLYSVCILITYYRADIVSSTQWVIFLQTFIFDRRCSKSSQSSVINFAKVIVKRWWNLKRKALFIFVLSSNRWNSQLIHSSWFNCLF